MRVRRPGRGRAARDAVRDGDRVPPDLPPPESIARSGAMPAFLGPAA